jgi:hypothetical protein
MVQHGLSPMSARTWSAIRNTDCDERQSHDDLSELEPEAKHVNTGPTTVVMT